MQDYWNQNGKGSANPTSYMFACPTLTQICPTHWTNLGIQMSQKWIHRLSNWTQPMGLVCPLMRLILMTLILMTLKGVSLR